MHWIKASRTDVYIVQTPEEMALSLEKAFADPKEPITSEGLLKVLVSQCPVPQEFDLPESEEST